MGEVVFALLISLFATICVLLIVAAITTAVMGGTHRSEAAWHEHQRSKNFFNRW